jgi:hypothetical protein
VGFGILWPWLVRTARFSAVLILNLAHKKEGIRALRENGAPVFIGGVTYRMGADESLLFRSETNGMAPG